VTLHQLNHDFPDDIDVLLVGPGGRKVLLMSDAGGENAATDLTLSFDDAAIGSLPDENALSSGTFKPTNHGPDEDVMINPAPEGPYASTLAEFEGADPNGVWALYVHDDAGQDIGVITGGWSLQVSAQVAVTSDVAIQSVTAPSPIDVGTQFDYTITVTNRGPNTANGVLVTDTLPGGVSFLSATLPAGAMSSLEANVVTVALGSLNVGESAEIKLTVNAPGTPGQIVNEVAVTAPDDPDATNNAAVNTVVVGSMIAAANQTNTPAGMFNVTISAPAGKTYIIEVSDDLKSWTTLRTITVTDGDVSVLDDVSGMNRRFYRTREQQ